MPFLGHLVHPRQGNQLNNKGTMIASGEQSVRQAGVISFGSRPYVSDEIEAGVGGTSSLGWQYHVSGFL